MVSSCFPIRFFPRSQRPSSQARGALELGAGEEAKAPRHVEALHRALEDLAQELATLTAWWRRRLGMGLDGSSGEVNHVLPMNLQQKYGEIIIMNLEI